MRQNSTDCVPVPTRDRCCCHALSQRPHVRLRCAPHVTARRTPQIQEVIRPYSDHDRVRPVPVLLVAVVIPAVGTWWRDQPGPRAPVEQVEQMRKDRSSRVVLLTHEQGLPLLVKGRCSSKRRARGGQAGSGSRNRYQYTSQTGTQHARASVNAPARPCAGSVVRHPQPFETSDCRSNRTCS
jgi:hypothetical protein